MEYLQFRDHGGINQRRLILLYLVTAIYTYVTGTNTYIHCITVQHKLSNCILSYVTRHRRPISTMSSSVYLLKFRR